MKKESFRKIKNKFRLISTSLLMPTFLWANLGIGVPVSLVWANVDLSQLQNNFLAQGQVSRKIVVFEQGVSDGERDEIFAQVKRMRLERFHNVLEADVIELSQTEEAKLLSNPKVKRIEPDIKISTLSHKTTKKTKKIKNGENAQTIPWGVEKIQAEQVWNSGNTGKSVKVGVIDTGISSNQPDLKNIVKGGVNIIEPSAGWNDDNGHGTHIAGIIAAANNGGGVVGVAPSVNLYAIKVLDSQGYGYLSDLIKGIYWAMENGIQVINLSLGSDTPSESEHETFMAANQAGIVIVAAAGNDGIDVDFPAAYPEVIAVGATNIYNEVADWSSQGPELDLVAPGVNIFSTYLEPNFTRISGTSMSAPHVVGVVALLLNTPVGSYDANNNGKWDPTEVQKKLQDKATDLGTAGFDNSAGWGLVNAYNAVQP